jgi:hypothetical protein
MVVCNKTVNYMHHGGVSRGAHSLLVLIPEYKLSIAMLSSIYLQAFLKYGKS